LDSQPLSSPLASLIEDAWFNEITESLAHCGYYIKTNALPERLIDELTLTAQDSKPHFQSAGIGRSDDHQINQVIRNDTIHWITGTDQAQAIYLNEMERLRVAINRRLYLGLFDYEAHFANYPIGGFYKKHVDAFKGQSNRVLTTVLYLNKHWREEEQGHLLLYNSEGSLIKSVLPDAGTLVIFLSEEFPHEVIPTARERLSIAGWFRINTSTSDKVDPPT